MSKQMHRRTFIREYRRAAGLSQEELGAAIGTKNTYVSEIENGVKRYNQTVLEGIAGELDLEPWQLLIKPEPDAIWSAVDRLVSMLPDDAARGALSGMVAGARTHLDKAG